MSVAVLGSIRLKVGVAVGPSVGVGVSLGLLWSAVSALIVSEGDSRGVCEGAGVGLAVSVWVAVDKGVGDSGSLGVLVGVGVADERLLHPADARVATIRPNKTAVTIIGNDRRWFSEWLIVRDLPYW